MNGKKHSATIPSDAVLCDLSADKKATRALEAVKAKYAHALTENVWRHGKKVSVLIRCTHPGCEAERFVHTSDLFQVSTCLDHKKGSKPVAEKAEKSSRRGARSKDGRKGARKSTKADKGTPRARKGKRIATREDFVAAATGKGE